MSKISSAVTAERKTAIHDAERHTSETVTNFMAGESYVCDPITTLKLVTASSIYGEPAYYRDGTFTESTVSKIINDGIYCVDKLVDKYSIFPSEFKEKKTSEIMEIAIDNALHADFKATLDWAVELRTKFNMRLNPQVIMVRAACHPDRQAFTEANPGYFAQINAQVMSRADESMSQMAYYIFKNKSKRNIPTILKKTWASHLSSLSRYKIAKYKNHEIGMIDAVRICHANSPIINELMKTGTVEVKENEMTWENLRSAGKDWKTIFHTCEIGHMALLRNLRGVFTEVEDKDFCEEYLKKLKAGVKDGKQFPFRYYTAMQAVDGSKCNHKALIINALEECMDIALDNIPRIKGKTICLSDNSGSAWGAFTSDYGKVTVADIDNLSSVMMASVSEEGYVGVFGDRLKINPIISRRGVLGQTKEMAAIGEHIGGATENGIWLFFRDAIDNGEFYDNIVIFSDQQAGHGGLYGTGSGMNEYRRRGFACVRYGMSYVNVMDLILEYRKKVNPKVNVLTVQTAGYDNVVIPENTYRCGIAYGWTGQEAVYLKAMTDIWDEVEAQHGV